jgi:hypothetical protein
MRALADRLSKLEDGAVDGFDGRMDEYVASWLDTRGFVLSFADTHLCAFTDLELRRVNAAGEVLVYILMPEAEI